MKFYGPGIIVLLALVDDVACNNMRNKDEVKELSTKNDMIIEDGVDADGRDFNEFSFWRALIDSQTSMPSGAPSVEASSDPSAAPSPDPTEAPTQSPSKSPSHAPSVSPTQSPSAVPSAHPSEGPTQAPSAMPSSSPSVNPTQFPTADPSPSPTGYPSPAPSVSPSAPRLSHWRPCQLILVAILLRRSVKPTVRR